MKRESLVLEIDSYIEGGIILYDQEKVVDKDSCLKVFLEIFNLKDDDFPSKEKYLHFSRFINHPERFRERYIIEKGFDGNFLQPAIFCRMCNYLERVKGWIKCD
jgi:hypothetical protein